MKWILSLIHICNEGSEDYYRTTKVRTESIGAATYRSVSYTHLDVYKRQDLLCGAQLARGCNRPVKCKREAGSVL